MGRSKGKKYVPDRLLAADIRKAVAELRRSPGGVLIQDGVKYFLWVHGVGFLTQEQIDNKMWTVTERADGGQRC